jgi:hypothetical protein
MCDLAVAAEEARFALPGVNVGIFCSTPAVVVVRNVGRKRAMEMLLTGEMVDARTALSWGLVNRVVPAAELDAEIARFTDIIVARSGAVVARGKRAFYRQIDQPIASAYEMTNESMACSVIEPDAAEGIDAFLGSGQRAGSRAEDKWTRSTGRNAQDQPHRAERCHAEGGRGRERTPRAQEHLPDSDSVARGGSATGWACLPNIVYRSYCLVYRSYCP